MAKERVVLCIDRMSMHILREKQRLSGRSRSELVEYAVKTMPFIKPKKRGEFFE